MDVSDRRQGRNPRTQHGHPAEDGWIPAQLIERSYFGMEGAEISQEIACRTTIERSRLGGQCATNRVDRASRQVSQGMRKWNTPRALHTGPTRLGRRCCSTA